MSFLKPSKNSFGLTYSLQVKQTILQPSPGLYFFFSTKGISSLPPIRSVLSGQLVTTLAFNSIFHFQVDFLWSISSEFCPSLSGFYQLCAESTDSSISLTSFFYFTLCFIRGFVFNISSGHLSCRVESLLRFFSFSS